jgi:hypothetical protein
VKYRKLGETSIKVSEIGLGTEYLNRKSRNTVKSVVDKAVASGVNYIDIVFSFKEYLENLGTAIEGNRDRVVITAHLGSAETNGHYRLTQDTNECEKYYNKVLSMLGTDHADIVFIQMVNDLESVERIKQKGGKLDLAKRLVKEGRARAVGVSGHKVPAILKVIEEDLADIVMFPINIAWDSVPGRKEVFEACRKKGIGLVAMKPFGGGRLFHPGKNIPITPIQCLSYILSLPGISTTVPGVANLKELEEILRYNHASAREKDYRDVIRHFQQELDGNCVYCNHCLPCPARIDIGNVLSRLDRAVHCGFRSKVDFYYPGRIRLGKQYFPKLTSKPSTCLECGSCMKRCPFNVDVISKMKEAASVLEKQSNK